MRGREDRSTAAARQGLRVCAWGLLLWWTAGCAARPELSELVFDAAELPGCRLAVVPEGAELPCALQGNPHISAEREQVECFARMALAHQGHDHDGEGAAEPDAQLDTLVAATQQILFSVYEGQGESGLFGFAFESEASATAAAEALRMRAAMGENGMVEQAGSLVAYIWYDEGGSECGFRLRELAREVSR